MPELPEVEIQCQRLFDQVVHSRIVSVDVIRSNGKYLPSHGGFLNGQMILNVWRRGKIIIFHLSEGIMTCHLAMSGYWDIGDDPWTFDYVEGKRKSTEHDVRVRFGLEGGRVLRFHDSRLFGSLRYHLGLKDVNSLIQFKKMGPEVIRTPRLLPRSPIINRQGWMSEVLSRSKREIPIKEFLMDQSRIAGLGNIYVTEVLHSLGIHPLVSVRVLLDRSLSILDESSHVLAMAIGRKLDYSALQCYRRSICYRDGSSIQMIKIKGRSSYFCPICQIM